MDCKKKRKGFGIIETIVVVAVMATIAIGIIPEFSNSLEKGNNARIKNFNGTDTITEID